MHDDDVPFASEAYVMAWGRLWPRFPELLLVAILWLVFAAVEGVLHYAGFPAASLYDLLVTVPLNFGALYACLRAARGQPVDPSHLFHAFRTAYLPAIGAHVLFIVLVGAGLIALVVPGIVMAARLSFVGFLVVDEGLGPLAAIRESWRRTHGFTGRILLLWLLGIPITLAGLALFGVGVVPAIMWIHLAFATLFVGVTEGYDVAAGDVSPARPTPAAT
jgi:hypothetical protein